MRECCTSARSSPSVSCLRRTPISVAQSTGLMISATNSEELSAAMRVWGR